MNFYVAPYINTEKLVRKGCEINTAQIKYHDKCKKK